MSRRTLFATSSLVLLTAIAAPGAGWAQFAQYTQPGTTGQSATELGREEIESALEEAPWHLGPVRLAPWFGLRNLSWNENPFGTPDDAGIPGQPGRRGAEGDLTATAGAGLRAYLPTGHHVFWAAHALPEYVWWADQDERNTLNGRFGVGVFGFFNRLTVQLTGRRLETQGIVTPEEPAEINTRRDELALAAETRLGFATSVFGEASATETRNLLEEDRPTAADFERLDRDERRARAGLRYRPRERWSFEVGYEWTESESTGEARDLSSTGGGPIASVRYTGPTFFAVASGALRDLEADTGSDFRSTDTETWSFATGLEGNRLSPVVYARRELALSIREELSHFTAETVGLSLATTLGRRTRLRAYAETGENEFVARTGVALERTDDVDSWGAELTFELFRNGRLRLGGHHTEIDSNLPGEDRTLDVVTTGIEIGFGSGGGDWV